MDEIEALEAEDTGHASWPDARRYAIEVHDRTGRLIVRRHRWAETAKGAALSFDWTKSAAGRAAVYSPDPALNGLVEVRAFAIAQHADSATELTGPDAPYVRAERAGEP